MLRGYRLGAQELWLDEAFSFHIATQPGWLAAARLDNTPPLYYLILRLWIWLAGTSDASIRSLLALAGGAGVGAAIWLARLIFDRATALWTGLALAASPLAGLLQAGGAAYALLMLLLLVAAARFWIAVESDRTRDWAWAALALTGALHAHYMALFVLLPLAALPLVLRRPERMARSGACAAAALALFVPWLLAGSRPGRGGRHRHCVDPPHLGTDSARHGDPQEPGDLRAGEPGGSGPALAQAVRRDRFSAPASVGGTRRAQALVAVLLWMSRAKRPETERRALHWLALLVLAPLGALWLVSFARPLYAAGRYGHDRLPGGSPVDRRRARVRAADAPAAVLGSRLGTGGADRGQALGDYRVPSERPAAASAEALDRRLHAGDAVVITGVRALPVFHALARRGYPWRDGYLTRTATGDRAYCRTFPRATERTPAALDASRAALPEELVRTKVDDVSLAWRRRGRCGFCSRRSVDRAAATTGTGVRCSLARAERRGWRRRPDEMLRRCSCCPSAMTDSRAAPAM